MHAMDDPSDAIGGASLLRRERRSPQALGAGTPGDASATGHLPPHPATPPIESGLQVLLGAVSPGLALLEGSMCPRETRNGDPVASGRLQVVLEVEIAEPQARTAPRIIRPAKSDPQDGPRKPNLGCATDSRGIA